MEYIGGATPDQWAEMGDIASQQEDWDAAIHCYRMALRGSLEPNLEMQVYWNCALAIWKRAGFEKRRIQTQQTRNGSKSWRPRLYIDECFQSMKQN